MNGSRPTALIALRRSPLVASLAALLCSLGAVHGAYGQSEAQDLATWLREKLPQRGAVTVVYKDAGSGDIGICGYDIATGAFYGCYHGSVSIRQTDGTLFHNPKPYTHVREWTESPSGIGDDVVDKAFPSVILYDIASDPASAESIQKQPDGGWIVSYMFYASNRTLTEDLFKGDFRPPKKRVRYHISPEARLTSIEYEGSEVIMSYADTSSVLPVTQHFGAGKGWDLVSCESFAGGNPGAFEQDTVLAAVDEAGILDDTIRWAPPGTTPTQDPQPDGDRAKRGSPTSAARPDAGSDPIPVLPKSKGPARFSLPVVGAGVVFVAVGVYAWIKRR